MKKTLCGIFILLVLAASLSFAAEDPLTVSEITEKVKGTVQENGDIYVEEDMVLSVTAYNAFKARYTSLNELARLFKPMNALVQIENMDIKLDDLNNKITATYIRKGAAINKGEHWEIPDAGDKSTSLSAQTENSLVFTTVSQQGDTKLTVTSTILFPSSAKNIKYDSVNNRVTYELPYFGMSGLWGWILGVGLFLLSGVFVLLAGVNHMFLKY